MASGAGELLGGRYQLLERLGSGGGGAVHRARDLVLDRQVAVRLLPPDAVGDQVRRHRLHAEARLTGSLRHPGIAQIYDISETEGPPALARPGPYVVMEFVDGVSLDDRLKAGGPLPVAEAMTVLRQVAEALQAAQEVGIGHRDLKPSRILLTPHGRSVLIGFAVSRAAEPGVPASPQSDVQALGALIYEALTGRAPVGEQPPFPGDVPAPVRGLVLEMLARDPAERPGSAQEIAIRASLLACAERVEPALPVEEPAAPAQPERAATGTAARPSVLGLIRQWLGRRRVNALPNMFS